MFEVEYYEDKKYLTRKFKGSLTIEDIIESWEFIIESKLKMQKFDGIINDFSNADLKMNINDLEKLLNLFKQNFEIFRDLKLAVVMTSPENIVFPVLAEKESPFKIKAFSTFKAAEEWMHKKEV